MTNIETTLDLIKKDINKTKINDLSMSETAILISQLEMLETFAKENKDQMFKSLEEKYPYEVDADGKLLNTIISNAETGETISIVKYKQCTKNVFNQTKAIESLKVSLGKKDVDLLSKELFYNSKEKTKTELEKALKSVGLTTSAIESCFDKEYIEPKITFTGLNKK